MFKNKIGRNIKKGHKNPHDNGNLDARQVV
jgi:hypothetical protein